MSASKNPDSMTNAQGEFHSRRAPAEPLTTKGHAPGVKVGNDAAPEFNAEIYPPGTAESVAPGRTFHPNPVNEVPGQANNSVAQNPTKASDTLVGSTSADVHDGFGHPGAGMTSQEIHGGHGKKERSGLESVGTSATDPISKRGQDMDHEKYGRLAKPGRPEDWETAEDKVAMRAEDVASERK